MNINAPLERELERLLASLAVEVTRPRRRRCRRRRAPEPQDPRRHAAQGPSRLRDPDPWRAGRGAPCQVWAGQDRASQGAASHGTASPAPQPRARALVKRGGGDRGGPHGRRVPSGLRGGT